MKYRINKVEMEEILKVFDKMRDAHEFKKMKFRYVDGLVEVKGRIPTSVILEYYQKIFSKNLEFASSKESLAILKNVLRGVDQGDLFLLKDSPNRFLKGEYSMSLIFQNKEELLWFLMECARYYKGKVENFEKIRSLCYKKLLQKIEPEINIPLWVKKDPKNEISYQLMKRNEKNFLDMAFREILNTFDLTVNPFPCSVKEFKKPYFLDFSFYQNAPFQFDDQKFVKLSIDDKESEMSLGYERKKDYISYEIRFDRKERTYFVRHEFSTSDHCEHFYYTKDDGSYGDYNITKQEIGDVFMQKQPITTEEKTELYNLLWEYICLSEASTIKLREQQVKSNRFKSKRLFFNQN